MSLNDFYEKRKGSDKFDLGYVDAFYDRLFLPRKKTTKSILEIGVQTGDSILLWKEFFTNARVYGIDVLPCPVNDGLFEMSCDPNSGIRIFDNTNAYGEIVIEGLKHIEPEGFDIIIDDGPHTYDSMVYFLLRYLPIVKSKGILILEDIIDPKWTPELLQLINPKVGKVTVVDMRHRLKSEQSKKLWSENGLDVIIVEKY